MEINAFDVNGQFTYSKQVTSQKFAIFEDNDQFTSIEHKCELTPGKAHFIAQIDLAPKEQQVRIRFINALGNQVIQLSGDHPSGMS